MAALREITRLLKQLAEGHREAEAPLMGMVYHELRRFGGRRISPAGFRCAQSCEPCGDRTFQLKP